MPSIDRTTLHRFGLLLSALLSVGAAIGSYTRDLTDLSQWLFFIPPLPTCIIALVALVFLRRVRMHWRFAALILAIPCAVSMIRHDFHGPIGRQDLEPNVSLLHWNVGRGVMGWDRIRDQIKKENRDIVVLSETGPSNAIIRLLQNECGYTFVHADLEMAIAARYPVLPAGRIPIASGRGWFAEVLTPGSIIRLAAVDFASKPSLNRHQPVADLTNWLATIPPQHPVLLVGDFNTPLRAIAFDPLRDRMRSAAEECGGGWPYSWPMPIPSYSLDHVWLSGSVTGLSHRYVGSIASDHLRQRVQLRIELPKGQPAKPLPMPPPFPGFPPRGG